MTFNSLYEIQELRLTPELGELRPFNSLYEIRANEGRYSNDNTFSFNSLYEIREEGGEGRGGGVYFQFSL